MMLGGIELCCPACRSPLDEPASSELRCSECRRRYPVILGIPDLRLFPDPYIEMQADRAKGRRLAERFADFDLEGLIDYYYSITPAVPPQHARRYTRGLMAAEARARDALTAWGAGHSGGAGAVPRALLEIGCGTAPVLVAAAGRFQSLAGIDIAFRWLVIGKKRLLERGLDVPLVCACAEALPFRAERFDVVVADSVIEHLASQRAALREARRVLRPRGRLFVSTPNKFSLGPDPHVGIWGGGFLPRHIIDLYVRRMGGVPPRRRLLSRSALSRLLRESGFGGARVFLPDIAHAQRSHFPRSIRTAIVAYQTAKRLPVASAVLSWIGPMFYATGEKGTQQGSEQPCPR